MVIEHGFGAVSSINITAAVLAFCMVNECMVSVVGDWKRVAQVA